MCCPENDAVTGKVTGFTDSPAGEIAFIETEDYGSVSVLLNATCWKGLIGPKKGELIVISGLARFTQGWRAMSARKYTLVDEV